MMGPMQFPSFSKNGQILPSDEAVIPFTNVEYAYGYGAYENIRVAHGKCLFLDDHVERLMHSATIIGLVHPFAAKTISTWTQELVENLPDGVFNLKVLLIGARDAAQCQLIILPLSPLFPEKRVYTQGATTITFEYERLFPQAKILNMFPSYYAFKKAKEAGAYDALLINRRGCITEGTRTNFFAIKGKTIHSPPAEEVLEGVTRKHVLEVAVKNGYSIEHHDLPLSAIGEYDGVFLTSTGVKIVPVKKIDDVEFLIPEELKVLMKYFDAFVEEA